MGEPHCAAHNVSLRQLYRLFSDVGLSLGQEVIVQRLKLARAQLVSPAGRRRSIAATARACGSPTPAISPDGSERRSASALGSGSVRSPTEPADTYGPAEP